MSQTREECVENHLCHKCEGLLVVERVLDFYGAKSGWKCVNCGWFRRESQPSLHILDTRQRGRRARNTQATKGATT